MGGERRLEFSGGQLRSEQMGGAATNPSAPSLNPNWVVLKQRLNGGRSGSPHPDPGAAGKPPSVLGTHRGFSFLFLCFCSIIVPSHCPLFDDEISMCSLAQGNARRGLKLSRRPLPLFRLLFLHRRF